MTIVQFNQKIAKNEGLKKQVNIAQIAEITRVINQLTGGVFYKIIQLMR